MFIFVIQITFCSLTTPPPPKEDQFKFPRINYCCHFFLQTGMIIGKNICLSNGMKDSNIQTFHKLFFQGFSFLFMVQFSFLIELRKLEYQSSVVHHQGNRCPPCYRCICVFTESFSLVCLLIGSHQSWPMRGHFRCKIAYVHATTDVGQWDSSKNELTNSIKCLSFSCLTNKTKKKEAKTQTANKIALCPFKCPHLHFHLHGCLFQ